MKQQHLRKRHQHSSSVVWDCVIITSKSVSECGGGDFSNKRCCEWNGMLVQVQQQMRSREVCSALQSLQRMLSTITGAVCPQPMQMAMFWHVTGKVFESAGSLERAVAVFSNVLVHYPVFPHTNDVHFRLGRILRRQSKPLLALRHFEQALCDLPLGVTRDDVMFEIAQTHEANHSFQQAQRAYLAIQPPTAMSLVRLAHLYTRHPSLQTQSQGMWLLKATLNTFPKCADGWLILSRVLALQGQPTEAYAALANAMLLEPSSPLLWCETGALYLDHAQYADAFKALERSYQLHSQVPETLCNLGLLYEIGGEHRQARDKYEEAQRISSDPAIAQRISRVTQALAASHNNNNSGNSTSKDVTALTILEIHILAKRMAPLVFLFPFTVFIFNVFTYDGLVNCKKDMLVEGIAWVNGISFSYLSIIFWFIALFSRRLAEIRIYHVMMTANVILA
eukprot:c12947_g1_i1.p1 GENE.c12947_g1_i1~~c12947_g1_i1.p1  ORF type:complete len:451 (-),score=145.05 c12947_g1_i1:57-1409(-)